MSSTHTQTQPLLPPTFIGSREKKIIIRQLIQGASNEIVVDEHGILRIPSEVLKRHHVALEARRDNAIKQLESIGIPAAIVASILKLDTKDTWYLSGFIKDRITQLLVDSTSTSDRPFSDPQVQLKLQKDALERASSLFIPRSLALIESIPGVGTSTEHTPLSAFIDSLRPRPALHTWTYQAEPYVYEAVLRDLGTRYLDPEKSPETAFKTVPSRYAGGILAEATKTRKVLAIHEELWHQIPKNTKKRLRGLVAALEDFGTSYEHVIGSLEPITKLDQSLHLSYPVLYTAIVRFQQTGESELLSMIADRIQNYNRGKELSDKFSVLSPEFRSQDDLPELKPHSDNFERSVSELGVTSHRPRALYSDDVIEYFYRSKLDASISALDNYDPDDPYFFEDLEYLYNTNPDVKVSFINTERIVDRAVNGQLVRRFPQAKTLTDQSTWVRRTGSAKGVATDEPDFGTYDFDSRRDPWRFLAAVVEDRIRQKGPGWKPEVTSISSLNKLKRGHAPFLRETLSAIGLELDIDPEVMFAPYVAANESWKNVCNQMKVIFGTNEDQLALEFPTMEPENWQDLRALFKNIQRDRSFMWANDAVSWDLRRIASDIALFKDDGKAFKQLRESFSMNRVAAAIILGTSPVHIDLVESGIVSVTTLEPSLLQDMLEQARVNMREVEKSASVSRTPASTPAPTVTPRTPDLNIKPEEPIQTPEQGPNPAETTQSDALDLEKSIETIARAFVQLGYDIGQRDSSAGVKRDIVDVVAEIKQAFQRD